MSKPINIPWPTCERCKAPVEKISSYEDVRTDETIFVVHCHGKVEETKISFWALMQLEHLRRGTAFRQNELRGGVVFAPSIIKTRFDIAERSETS